MNPAQKTVAKKKIPATGRLPSRKPTNVWNDKSDRAWWSQIIDDDLAFLKVYKTVAAGGLGFWLLIYAISTLPAASKSGHFSTWLFLALPGFGFWGLIVLLVIPEIIRGIVNAYRDHTSNKAWFVMAAALFLVALPVYDAGKQHWDHGKSFDDVMAVSNAHVLAMRGFDQDQMFFRSFLRVGFVAAALPVVYNIPTLMPTITKSQSDRNRRIWTIFHDTRAGTDNTANGAAHQLQQPGQAGVAPYDSVGIFDRLSLLVWMLAMMLAAMGFRVLQALEVPAVLALLGGWLATHWFFNSLETLLTQTFTYVVAMIMVLAHFSTRTREPSWLRVVVCGFAIGLAGLTMNTLALVAIGIAVDQAVLWYRSSFNKGLMIKYAAQWLIAGVIVLVWFEGFLRGFLFESRLFKQEVEETNALMSFTPISNREVGRIATQVYGTWGILLLAGAFLAGLVMLYKRPAFPAMLVWLVVSFLALAAMPFVFPRFLMYPLLPAAWFVVSVMAVASQSLQNRRQPAKQ